MTSRDRVPVPLSPSAAARGLDDVDVVFLAWREAPAMLARHHAAVAAAVGPDWRGRAVLIENAAAPRTSAAARNELRIRYPHADRRVLAAPRNLGFARAMDLALDACRARYVAVMNSDGQPGAGMLGTLAAALDTHPDAVWAAPGVHGPGEPDHPPGAPYAEEEIPGMALLIRRDAFLAAGGFDPQYFFYNEDYDASRRLRAAGHVLLRVPDARFHHGKGGRSRRGAFLRELHYARTAQLLAFQHEPRPARFARRRAASIATHARDRNWPAAAGIALATTTLPASLARAARRRARPWDGVQLEAWLAENRVAAQPG